MSIIERLWKLMEGKKTKTSILVGILGLLLGNVVPAEQMPEVTKLLTTIDWAAVFGIITGLLFHKSSD